MKHIKLKSSELRVINIGTDAIFEWLCEEMIEHSEHFFGIKDSTEVLYHCDWDETSGQFTCAIEPSDEVDGKPVFHDIDFSHIRSILGETTDSLFSECCYKTLDSQEDAAVFKSQ